MDKEEFMRRMLFNERVKKISKARKKDRESNCYSAERCFERNRGKVDTWKHSYVNMER